MKITYQKGPFSRGGKTYNALATAYISNYRIRSFGDSNTDAKAKLNKKIASDLRRKIKRWKEQVVNFKVSILEAEQELSKYQ